LSNILSREDGINPIFDDRADEAIVYPPALQSELPKREEKPDRVYGLRRTKRLERLLLWTEDKRPSAEGRPIGDNLKSSPFRPDGEPIVFPFLVIEAKSEKGADAFTDIEVQTAFAIRELLSIQDDLRQAAEADWDGGPLVWFLSYKGEQWRVSAACIGAKSKNPCYVGLRSNSRSTKCPLTIFYCTFYSGSIESGAAESIPSTRHCNCS
jgi:hypothetical protein